MQADLFPICAKYADSILSWYAIFSRANPCWGTSVP
jgi:hypothetical protein